MTYRRMSIQKGREVVEENEKFRCSVKRKVMDESIGFSCERKSSVYGV